MPNDTQDFVQANVDAISARRKWLLIAHSFNMDGRAASQTVTDKLRHLEAAGIDCTIISAVTGRKDPHYRHIQLLPFGPSGLRFDLRHIVAKRYGRGIRYRLITLLVSLLLLPFMILERLIFGLTHHSSWTLSAARKGRQLVEAESFELVFSSGGAWSAHLAAALIKRKTGIKWIAEIHDPMVIRDDEVDDGTAPRNNRTTRYMQKVEGVICREADHIWWFTDGALDYALLRHPELGSKGFVLYPGAEPPEVTSTYVRSKQINLCHFGSMTDDRSLQPVLAALEKVVANDPGVMDELRIHVYGSDLDNNSKRQLEDSELSDVIVEHGRLEHDPITGMSGRARVTAKMFEADVLLLLHGDYEWCEEYIPSKYYEYLWVKRPILAVTNRNEAFVQTLSKRNHYLCKTHDQESIVATLTRMIEDWRADQLRVPAGDADTVAAAVSRIVEAVS